MNTLVELNGAQQTGLAGRKRDTSLFVGLEVVDPELVAELEKYPEGTPREKYALGALRLGALAIRQASGELDVRRAAKTLLDLYTQLQAAQRRDEERETRVRVRVTEQ